MAEADDNKAQQKVSAGSVNDKAIYEETAFGRRRVSKVPKWLAASIRFGAIPILFVYRRLRRGRGA